MWDFSDIWLLTQQIRMCLLCKIRQNIWSAFLKSLPLHHITPEWWNGRHEGLKIPWPLRLYEFESRFRHLPSVGFPAGGIFCALAFGLVSLYAHPYEGELSCVIVGLFSKVVCFLGRLLLELVSPLRCNTKTKAIPSG